MKQILLAMILSGGPLWAQGDLPGMDWLCVEVQQDGKRFICALRQDGDVAVAEPCLELLTPQQRDTLVEARALGTAETARADAAEGALAAVRAEAADTAAKMSAEIAALTGELDKVQGQLAPFLAANAGAASDATTLDLVIAVEQAAVKLGLLNDTEVAPLALDGLALTFEGYGNRCGATMQTIGENGGEDALQATIYGHMFKALGFNPEISALYLSLMFDKPNVADAPHKAFSAMVDTVGVDATHEKGLFALNLSRRNLERVDDSIEKALTDPAHVALNKATKSIEIVGCE